MASVNKIHLDHLMIRKLCDERNYLTFEDFFNAIHTWDNAIERETAKSWYYKPSSPRLGNLLKLCDFFDCDIDFLLGRMDETTHTRKYLCKETGLSEKAIKTLQNSPTQTYGGFLKLQGKQLGTTINHLLTDEHGLRLLQYLSDYLASDTLELTYQGKPVKEDIIVSNSKTQNTYSLSPSEYDSIILTQIQQEVLLLKHAKSK